MLSIWNKNPEGTDHNHYPHFIMSLSCKFSISYPPYYNIIFNYSLSVSTSFFSCYAYLFHFYYSDFRSLYANLRYGQTSEVAAGQMWFFLILF